MVMEYKQEYSFLGLINSYINSFSRLFTFISPLANKKQFDMDVYLIMERLREKLPQQKIKSFMDTRIIPKMPDLLWHEQDINIFISEIKKWFEEEKIGEMLKIDSTINLPRNISQTKRFLKDSIRIAYSAMLKEVSEQYELIKQESINEKSLPHLKISGEFMQTLDLTKKLINEELKSIDRLNFKKFEKNYSNVSLLLLRMYSVGKEIQNNNSKEALKNTRFLGMERTRIMLEGG